MMDQFTFLKDAYCNLKEMIVIVDSAALLGGRYMSDFPQARLPCWGSSPRRDEEEKRRRGGGKKKLLMVFENENVTLFELIWNRICSSFYIKYYCK